MKASEKSIIQDPSGTTCSASIRSGRVIVLRPERCGLYSANSGDTEQLLAFNWLPDDQYCGTGPAGENQDEIPRFLSKSLHGWQLCLVLAGIVLLAESWLFHRHILQFS
jgi:hypothetical protein